jgi:hypothetical protein
MYTELLVTMHRRLSCCFRRIRSMLVTCSPDDGAIRQANARNQAQLGATLTTWNQTHWWNGDLMEETSRRGQCYRGLF